jgi:uncharacterized protein
LLKRAALAVGLVALATLTWGFLIEPGLLRNDDYEIALEHWSSECSGLRIAVLADLHVGSPFNGLDKLDRIVALTEKAAPDLILLAGDYVISGVPGGHFTPPEAIARSLSRLSAPLGTWAVLGNHDWWFDAARVRAALEANGIPVLDESVHRMQLHECEFWLAGIGDYWEGHPDVAKTLAAVGDDAPVLAFTHNPDVFPEIPARVSLTIAGHTHGGQVDLPLIGRPIVPSKYGQRYAAGPLVEDGRHLFVSTGLGTSIVPVRFRVPPEISVLTLRAADVAQTTAARPRAARRAGTASPRRRSARRTARRSAARPHSTRAAPTSRGVPTR